MAEKSEKEIFKSQDHDVEGHNDEKHDARRRSTIAGVLQGGADKAIEGQMFSMNDIDPALDAKMRLVNQVSPATALASISLTNLGHQPDRLDELPPQAVLPEWVWVYGRQLDPCHTVRHCWPSCGRIPAILCKRSDFRFVCWHVGWRSLLGRSNTFLGSTTFLI